MSVHNVLFEDRGATLLWIVQKLPSLQDLSITYEEEASELRAPVSDSNGLPWCKDLAKLRSSSLTDLKVCMLGGPIEGNTLRLSGVPALRSCTLIDQEPSMPHNMRIDAESFRGLSQLQTLYIDGDEGLQLQAGSLGQLSTLTSLSLVQCGLRTVPADVASLSATLRELDLGYNLRMQIDSAAVALVAQCSSLRVIGLSRPDITKWEDDLGPAWQHLEQHMERDGVIPAQFDVSELTQLLHMPHAFRRRHGRDLHVCLQRGGLCYDMSCFRD